jgi:hypothetical protein
MTALASFTEFCRIRVPAWVKRLLRVGAVEEPAAIPAEAAPSTKQPAKRKTTGQTSGVYYLKESILDQLDRYFHYLARMKRSDRQSYDLYKRVGAHIVPGRFRFHNDGAVSKWWVQNMPAFGAVAWGTNPEIEAYEEKKDWACPKFFYFRKYQPGSHPVEVEMFSGSVYVLTAYWDDGKSGRGGAPTEYGVGVADDGSIHMLRTLVRRNETPKARGRNRKSGGRQQSIPCRRWQVDPFFAGWAKEHNKEPREMFAGMFVAITQIFEDANSGMTRIAAKKGNMTAVFSVAMERTPYFFQDRDVGLEGKKRVFHIVKAHQRTTGDKVSFVRTHFRGERKFRWNGYDVDISVPGWHSVNLAEFNVGAVDPDRKEIAGDTIDMKDVAKTLVGLIDKDEGGEAKRRKMRKAA